MKTTVFTCTFADYDLVFPPLRPEPDCAYLLFSDARMPDVRGWDRRPIPEPVAEESQAMKNRYCRFFPGRVLGAEAGDVAVYVDGNIILKGRVGELAREFYDSGADLGLFDHSSRETLEEELDACVRIGKLQGAQIETARAQLARYEAAGMDFRGLSENGVLFYRLDSPRLARFGEIWWEEFRTGVPRDQLSIAWAIRESGLKAHRFGWSFRTRNPYFHRIEHRGGAAINLSHWLHYQSLRSGLHKVALAPARRLVDRIAYAPRQ